MRLIPKCRLIVCAVFWIYWLFLNNLKLVDILFLMNHSKLLRELMFRNIAYLIIITYQSTRPFHIIWKACRYLNESIQNSQNEIYAFFKIVPKTGNYRHHLTDRYQPNQRRCWIYWTSHKSENIFWPNHFHILVNQLVKFICRLVARPVSTKNCYDHFCPC